ncbi:hypothetical protein [Acidicapsa acidisoli]|uniref:hypothetical protein n=1 Tax=Acidicapsa acidisoli TaxID=1615681 RepID=UPI0021E0C3B9|nr:hypothetical protein [Acidicapsa acidisoli]
MLPNDLKAEHFAAYPPQARSLIVANLSVLQQLPISFVPSLLREAIDYDYKFPAEQSAISRELLFLTSLSPQQLRDLFQGFSQLSISSQLKDFDWINQPAQFVEQLSAYLWTTHQLDAFRKAATDYGDRMRTAAPLEPIPMRRLGIAVIGQGVASYDAPLFRNLRKHGTYFSQVKPENGLDILLSAVAARAKEHPVPYGHWYVDGAQPADHSHSLTCVSYQTLEPARAALLKKIDAELHKPGMGPEELRTHLARLLPSDIGMDKAGDEVLDRFQVKLLTEGSGTQIFSTTFAQWTTREVLRRAQALTLLVRYAPRQRQKPMNEMLSGSHSNPEVDATGSLVDADMAAYYHWINQQRLPASEHSSFVVWFEGHSEALAVAPSLPHGTQSNSAMDLGQLLSLVLG